MASKKLTFQKQTPLGVKVFEKTPILQTTDIIAANSFAAPDKDQHYGVLFQLAPRKAKRFQQLTQLHRGRYLLVQFNGRVIDLIRINSVNPDDKVCIWRDITLPELKMIDQNYPKIGESKKDWKARLKATKKTN